MPTNRKGPEPPWQVILEEIHSQNRATIEAVETNREALEQRMDQYQERTEARFDIVEAAIKGNREAIEGNREAIEGNREAIKGNREAIEGNREAIEGNREAIEGNRGAIEGNRGAIEGNRGAIEGLERRLTVRIEALEQALNRVDQESRARDVSLELAIRELKVSMQQSGVDSRNVGARLEALNRLEERVAALERRSA